MPVQRSMTGKHKLLTARKVEYVHQTAGARLTVVSLLFGKGTVIYRIWPAVIIHTIFSAMVVCFNEFVFHIGFGTVLLTVVSMVLGFVIALRVTTGYDRYWMGRTGWSDAIRNIRTLSRLIWYHCPPRLTPNRQDVPLRDIERALEEKKIALDLLEAFAFALKHHVRDEPGPYYEDLNHLLVAMELSPYHTHRFPSSPDAISPATIQNGLPSANPEGQYGTFEGNAPGDPNAPLLPSSTIHRKSRIAVYMDLVPFSSWFTALKSVFSRKKTPVVGQTATAEGSGKHVVIAGGGGNIPLEIIRTLSEWMAALEERGTVPGTTLGGMIALLQMLEDTLTVLERILTTPLPLVYTAHIRHTVWIFLFTIPFQLCDTFGYITIPSVAVASFLYLGFVAAGEEIEQPFGYDRNDLDLDFFCREIIHNEIEDLRKSMTPASYLSLPNAIKSTDIYGRGAIVDAATVEAEADVKTFDPAHPLNGVPSTSEGGY